MDSDKWECGKGARKCVVKWFPEEHGIYLLRSLPRGKIPGARFIPGSREAIESAVRGIMKTYAKYPGYVVKYNEWLAKMPMNDDVYAHIKSRGLFVPFEKHIFGDSVNRILNSPLAIMDEAQFARQYDSNLLPTVVTTESVQWSGRGDRDVSKPANHARLDIETGLPAQDCRPNAASKRANERKRKKDEIANQISSICEGDEIFINLRAWPEYDEEWPYDTQIENTYVKGIYGKTTSGGKKRRPSVPTFKLKYTVDKDWIEEHGLVFELPTLGILYFPIVSNCLT